MRSFMFCHHSATQGTGKGRPSRRGWRWRFLLTGGARPLAPNPPPRATQLGVLREVYDRWERDETEPPVGFWKRILHCLGYYPMPRNGGGTADLVLMARRVHGLSQYALERKLGVIAKTVRLWEGGVAVPDSERLKRLRTLAGSPQTKTNPTLSGYPICLENT